MKTLRLGIHGAGGRMGKRLVALTMAAPDLQLAAALESPGHPQLGADAGLLAGEAATGIVLRAELDAEIDVLIDFSVPTGAQRATQLCHARRIPLVVATTGLEPQQLELIQAASHEIPIVHAPSMSMAVNLTMKLAGLAGKTLVQAQADADVEILERHHRYKEDAPSGTALRFGEIIANEMGLTRHQHGREGRPGQRPRNEIGYHAIRTGDNPGEHTIVFGMLGETIELTVRASNRDCYASGALAAARFVQSQRAGIYDMYAVLGLS